MAIFLNASDFHYERSSVQDGYLLCNSIKNLSFVLFYGKGCPHCEKLIPIIRNLPGKISGIIVCMALVNKELWQYAEKTITKIKEVPLMILYVDGKPFVHYSGQYTEKDIVNFIIDVSKKIQQKQQFHNSLPPKNKNQDQKIKRNGFGNIPAYSLGIPITDEDVSYVTFDVDKGYMTFKQKSQN